jgi:hypothetical protein
VTSRRPPRSFEKFNYLLRAAKQVERRLLVTALQQLRQGGIDIPNYTYLGFGSPFYADFGLFYRALNLRRSVCVEAQHIPLRMKFNRPFPSVRLLMAEMSEVIPRLSRTTKYLAWLDYDSSISDGMILDLRGVLGILARGSIVIVTADAEPRVAATREDDDIDAADVDRVLEYYRARLDAYVPGGVKRGDLTRLRFRGLLVRALRALMADEVSRRPGLHFEPLVGMSYADNAQMVSVGGVIADPAITTQIQSSGVTDLSFVRQTGSPIHISVEHLTSRERQYLEQRLTTATTAANLPFEVPARVLSSYRKFGYLYPDYREILM